MDRLHELAHLIQMANTFQDICHLPPRKPRKLVAGFCLSLKAWEPWDQLQISGQDCKSENLEVNGGDWYTTQSLKARQAEVLGSKAGGSKWMTHPWERKINFAPPWGLYPGPQLIRESSLTRWWRIFLISPRIERPISSLFIPRNNTLPTIRISHNPVRLIPKIKHHSIQYHVKHG